MIFRFGFYFPGGWKWSNLVLSSSAGSKRTEHGGAFLDTAALTTFKQFFLIHLMLTSITQIPLKQLLLNLLLQHQNSAVHKHRAWNVTKTCQQWQVPDNSQGVSQRHSGRGTSRVPSTSKELPPECQLPSGILSETDISFYSSHWAHTCPCDRLLLRAQGNYSSQFHMGRTQLTAAEEDWGQNGVQEPSSSSWRALIPWYSAVSSQTAAQQHAHRDGAPLKASSSCCLPPGTPTPPHVVNSQQKPVLCLAWAACRTTAWRETWLFIICSKSFLTGIFWP